MDAENPFVNQTEALRPLKAISEHVNDNKAGGQKIDKWKC
jgi:hypothetical protein